MEQETELTVDTVRFGAIEVAENTVITLPRGLLGMEQLTRFVLLDGAGPFQWLQSMDDPEACFVVIDSEQVVADYQITPSEDDLKVVMGEAGAAAMAALLIVTIPRESQDQITANLMAPLLFNTETRTGVQAVLPERYPVRHKITVRKEMASAS